MESWKIPATHKDFSSCRFPFVCLKQLLTDSWTDNTKTFFCLSCRLAQNELFPAQCSPRALPSFPSHQGSSWDMHRGTVNSDVFLIVWGCG